MKFKLVEEIDILENVRQNIKADMCRKLNLPSEDKFVLHHMHNETYNKDDENSIRAYKDVENCVLIPRQTPSGNDVHHLIHFLAQHEHELNTLKGYGIQGGKPVQYSLRKLVDILKESSK